MPYIPYLPYIPNIPYFPNMPYQTDHTHHTYPTYHTTPPPHHRGGGGQCHTPTTPQGGGGGRSHMGPVYGTHPMGVGGRGGVAGPGAYIHLKKNITTMFFSAETSSHIHLEFLSASTWKLAHYLGVHTQLQVL